MLKKVVLLIWTVSGIVAGCEEAQWETDESSKSSSIWQTMDVADGGVTDAGVDLVWIEQQKLYASDGTEGDALGKDVYLDGNTALVGATTVDVNGINSGATYVFVRSGDSFVEQQKLVPADGAEEDYFGRGVVQGDTAIITALLEDENGENTGAAYVFTRTGESWTEQQKLMASDGVAEDAMGWYVSLDGDTTVISSNTSDNGELSGAAYVFVYAADTWTEQQKLIPADNAEGDFFGPNAVSGDTILIGANGDDDNGEDSGSAYIFVRSGDTWTEQQKLLPSDGEAGDEFGFTVSLDGDTALISALGDDDSGNDIGALYVFVKSGDTWIEQQKLVPDEDDENSAFGFTNSIDGDRIIVGMLSDYYADSASETVYIFTRSGDVWTKETKFGLSDGEASDSFGYSVSISGETLLIGALGDGDNGFYSGAAYIFEYGPPLPVGEFCGGNTQCISGFCVDGVCCQEACGGNSLLDCQSCSIAAGSSSDGVCEPLDGTLCSDDNPYTFDDFCVEGDCVGTPQSSDSDSDSDTDSDSDADSDADSDSDTDTDTGECSFDDGDGSCGCTSVGSGGSTSLLKLLVEVCLQSPEGRR